MSATEAIARLRELRAKATPAPWSAKKEAFDDDEWERQYVYHAIPNGEMPVAFPLGGTREDANAAAIVAAMNSLPALLECASVLELLVGSIDAAQFEGLHDAIANEDAERMKDLLTRRILHHEHDARAALDALAQTGENNA